MLRALFVLMLAVYVSLSLYQGDRDHLRNAELTPTLPSAWHQVVAGYTRQLFAESLYIKSVIFLGTRSLPKVELYKNNLFQHFLVIQALHPKLIDTYYLTESSFSWVSLADTKRANMIMSSGIDEGRSDEWILYFFKGFNEFYYLQESAEAARTLYGSSKSANPPSWLLKLATVLAGKGGELRAGLAWLKLMLKSEVDKDLVKRYRRDIVSFEKALIVESALKRYENLNQVFPDSLEDLVPDYLIEIPIIKGDGYALSYKRQELRLLRER